jgi:hypothetical protein
LGEARESDIGAGRGLPREAQRARGGSMIGVIRYAGPCMVCEHPDTDRITTALRAYAAPFAITETYPELRYRDVKQHERQCLLRVDEGGGGR